ncbi:hypothetical protein T265_15213, partial [Opisthorchis viverrini]
LGQASNIPAQVLPSGDVAAVNRKGVTAEWSVVRTRLLPLDLPCLGLGDLAVSQHSCFLQVPWQLDTGRKLQLNDYFIILDEFTGIPRKDTATEKDKTFGELSVHSHVRKSENTKNVLCSQTSGAFLGGQASQEEQTDQPSRMRLGNPGILELWVAYTYGVVLAPDALKWLEREFTDRKVYGSNPNCASQLPLSTLGQPGSIPILVQPSGGIAVSHRKGATAE